MHANSVEVVTDEIEMVEILKIIQNERSSEEAVEFATRIKDLLEDSRTAKAIKGLEAFKENWCETIKGGKHEFRCNDCVFNLNDDCFVNCFIIQHH